MGLSQLAQVAASLVAPGKGILAADESTPTIRRRFQAVNAECTEESRRDYREMLFRTPRAEEFISGAILFDETIRQEGRDGAPLVRLLEERGIIPGVKVDKGAKELAKAAGEVVTEGLDGLRERLSEYRELGARFTKWRAVIRIGDGIPSSYGIRANAHALARFAALSQEEGLAPIVEPEVLMDGDHDIDRCFEASEATLRELFYELAGQRVELEGTLLKPSMVISGKDAEERAGPEEVARKTLACMKRVTPAAVAGLVFLSGGQGDQEATANLDAINRLVRREGAPWEVSFSFGRGLQSGPLKAWSGSAENYEKGQKAFLHRACVTSAARRGVYTPDLDKAPGGV